MGELGTMNRQTHFILNTGNHQLVLYGYPFIPSNIVLWRCYPVIPCLVQALAYLFRIEVAKQSDLDKNQQNLGWESRRSNLWIRSAGSIDSTLIDYAGDEVKQLNRYLMSDSPAICIVSGERGVGSTTLLYTLLRVQRWTHLR